MNIAATPSTEFLDYLDVLTGGASDEAFIELRWRVRETGMAAEFFARRDTHRLAAAVNERSRSTDLYIGCAPRAFRRGDKQAVREVWTLWVECDGAESAAAAQRLEPPPTLVV